MEVTVKMCDRCGTIMLPGGCVKCCKITLEWPNGAPIEGDLCPKCYYDILSMFRKEEADAAKKIQINGNNIIKEAQNGES